MDHSDRVASLTRLFALRDAEATTSADDARRQATHPERIVGRNGPAPIHRHESLDRDLGEMSSAGAANGAVR
ncbi:hypothetical protein [Gordonia humi]|uniref:Uncharacterized protein n=1 Tax=Gordonia humi TaxID=686429 RepID=A0A840EZZ7_9ACTN|nr:hypothetical protein [Gordonia humi]MBB4133700.1 hypothetical protein [Gordonia humi]